MIPVTIGLKRGSENIPGVNPDPDPEPEPEPGIDVTVQSSLVQSNVIYSISANGECSAYAAAALYDQNGKLKDIQMDPVALTPAQASMGMLSFAVDVQSTDSFKFFLLDQNTLAPLK